MRDFSALQQTAWHRKMLGALGAIILSNLSCSPDKVVTLIPEDHARLKAIVTVYAYACRDLRRPPKSVEELMPIFEQARIENPREYLKSTRDGQSYVIIWGLDLQNRYLGSNFPIAYEQVGQDGMRLLVTCNQVVKELSFEALKTIEWPLDYEPARRH